MKMPESIELLGVKVHRVTLADAADLIVRAAAEGVGGWAVTPNLDILRRVVRDTSFRGMYDQTTLRLADGMPLVWASKLRRTPLPERAAGSDLIFALAERAAALGVPIYLIGGNPGRRRRLRHGCGRCTRRSASRALNALNQGLIGIRRWSTH